VVAQSVELQDLTIGQPADNTWLTGKVQRGQQLGGKLGFPTLNLDPTLLPATVSHGVYAAQVEYNDQIHAAAAHFGPRKTLGEWRPTLEFHLLDFDQHIPGALIRFRLLDQIRTTLRFDSLDALKKQLGDDITKVRKLFS
jgi:riboflavin kinase/FMN adenylyltransferase